jgi:large subunit ribosomal protein L25
MRQIQELSAEPRTTKGKGPAYQIRCKGQIPGIVYGGKEQPQPVSVDAQVLTRLFDSGAFLTSLFMLDIAGKKTRVIPRALQLDPVSDRPVHVDFMRLAEGASVKLAIPVHFRGQENSPGLKRGGVLNLVRHEVELICSADNIPDYIEGDLDGLEIHGTLSISDFKLPEGVKPAIQGDFTVVSIVAPTHVIEEQKAAAAAAAAAALAPVVEEGEVPVEGAVPGAAPAPGAAAPGAAPVAGAASPAAGAAPAAGAKPAAGTKAQGKEKK